MPITMSKSVLHQKKSNWGWDLEPEELRELKFQLANLKCKCNACQRIKPLHDKQDTIEPNTNRGIQANHRKNSSDSRFIQVTPGSVLSEVYVSQSTANQSCTEKVCPNCFAAFNFLHTGVTRVVKDEESETITMITCDKFTGRDVKIVERATSTISNPVSGGSTDLMACDLVSESSTEALISNKPNRAKVTFSGIQQKELLTKPNCTCLEKFIDSIRPPLIGF